MAVRRLVLCSLLLLLPLPAQAFTAAHCSRRRAMPLPAAPAAVAAAGAGADAPAAPLCLLHLAYDGTRFRGWQQQQQEQDEDGQEEAQQPPEQLLRPPKRRHPKRPPPPPTLSSTLATALSVIHSRAPPRSLGLEAAVPTAAGVSARAAQLAFYRPPAVPSTGEPPVSSAYYPFGGDWARAAHSLNRILPEDLRVLSVGPPPWAGFHPRRDLASGRFLFTVLLGAAADPTLRHHGWVVDALGGGGEGEEHELAEGAKRIEAVAEAALTKDVSSAAGVAPFPFLRSVRVTPSRGPGVGAARAAMYRIHLEVAEPMRVDQAALVAWLGRIVLVALGRAGAREGEAGPPPPPLAALVLEELVFRERGGGAGTRDWVVRDPSAASIIP